MRLLIDEMWPRAVAEQVRQHLDAGRDAVVAVVERDDLRSRPDAEIFSAAQEEGRAVVTENVRDFRPLAARRQAQGRVHAGLVLTSNRRWPRARAETAGRLVVALVDLVAHDTTAGEPSSRELWL